MYSHHIIADFHQSHFIGAESPVLKLKIPVWHVERMSTIWVFKGGWQLRKSAVNLQSGGVLFDYRRIMKKQVLL
jgi:hypothetical protein